MPLIIRSPLCQRKISLRRRTVNLLGTVTAFTYGSNNENVQYHYEISQYTLDLNHFHIRRAMTLMFSVLTA